VDQVTQQNTAASEQSAAAAEELSGQAGQLKELLSRFQLASRDHSSEDELKLTPELMSAFQRFLAASGGAPIASKPSRPNGVNGHHKPTNGSGRAIDPRDVISLDDADFGRY
jgi:hypothetical protein